MAHQRMRHQRCASRRAGAGDNVADTVGQASFLQNPGDQQRGQGRLLGRLDHHRAARRQGRCDATRHGGCGVVPGNDVRRHTHRLAHRHGDVVASKWNAVALQLVGDASVVLEDARRGAHIRQCLCQRLAVVDGFHHGQVFGLRQYTLRRALEDAAALRRRRIAPTRPHGPVG